VYLVVENPTNLHLAIPTTDNWFETLHPWLAWTTYTFPLML